MSAQVVSDRKRKRIAASTGLNVVRAWSHGGYWLAFVTADHRHGWWNVRSHEVEWDDDPVHYVSCEILFPNTGSPTPTAPATRRDGGRDS